MLEIFALAGEKPSRPHILFLMVDETRLQTCVLLHVVALGVVKAKKVFVSTCTEKAT